MIRTASQSKVEFNFNNKEELTPMKMADNLQNFKKSILFVRAEKEKLIEKIKQLELKEKDIAFKNTISKVLIYGFFSQKHKDSIAQSLSTLQNEKAQILAEAEGLKIDLSIQLSSTLIDAYYYIDSSFRQMAASRGVWNITQRFFYAHDIPLHNELIKIMSVGNLAELNKFNSTPLKYEMDNTKPDTQNTYYKIKSKVDRTYVLFERKACPSIDSIYKAFYMKDAKGIECYIYPHCVILEDALGNITIKDIGNIQLTYSPVLFIERGVYAPDAKIAETTWMSTFTYIYDMNYNNKYYNHTPNFANSNPFQQPTIMIKPATVFEYGKLIIKIDDNWECEFQVTQSEATQNFVQAFEAYKNTYKSEATNSSI